MNQHLLWNTIINQKTMLDAWFKVRDNAGAAGGDGVTVQEFSANYQTQIKRLIDALKTNAFEHGPYRQVKIPKRKGGFRTLTIPPIADRIIHTAIAETIEPVLEDAFEHSSFAYRHGKSVQQAVRKIEALHRQGYCHVIEADIVDYFNAIDHALLLSKLKALIPQSAETKLYDFVVDLLIWQGQTLGSGNQGLVQGSPLSPILANLYLDALDESMQGDGVRIVRFADDFIIVCTSEKRTEAALQRTVNLLARHKLKLHPKGTQITSFDDGFEFLGHLFLKNLAIKKTRLKQTRIETLPSPQKPNALASQSEAKVGPSSQVHVQTVQPKEAKERYDVGDGVLYIMQAGNTLSVKNESFSVVDEHGNDMLILANHRVGHIEIGPKASTSWDAIENALMTETALAFVDGRGKTLATLSKPDMRYASTQLGQAKMTLNGSFSCGIAKSLVDARIRNQRAQLFRLNRRQNNTEVAVALKAMQRVLRKLAHCEANIDQIRGHEGEAGRLFWPALAILADWQPCPFKRSRPAADAPNAALNYMTSLLERDVRVALSKTRLHNGFGFLHSARDYAEALIYDLMEPFRAPLTEGLVAYLFNSNRLKHEMFDVQDGHVRIHSVGISAIIKGYESAVAKRINITGQRKKLAWRPMMVHQANSLVRAVEAEDVALFQPYLMEV